MADVPTISIVDGLPTAGTGEVQTISNITTRLGEVQATPTANTLLSRVKAAVDLLTTEAANTTLMVPDIDTIRADTALVKADIALLVPDIDTIRADTALVKADIALITADIDTMRADTALIKTDIAALLAEAVDPAAVEVELSTDAFVANNDAAAAINPLLVGGYASVVRPTAVSADLDAVRLWLDRYGALGVLQTGYDTVTASWVVDTNQVVAGDVMATNAFEIANFFRHVNGAVKIHGLTVHDADDFGIGFDLVLETAATSLGTQNLPPTISAANAENIKKWITVDASDYLDLINSRKAQTGLERTVIIKAGGSSTSLWVSGIARGTATYAGGIIKLAFNIEHVG